MKTFIIIILSCMGITLSGQQIEKLDGRNGYNVNGEFYPKFEDLESVFAQDPKLDRKFDKYLKIRKGGRISAGISAVSLLAVGIISLTDTSTKSSKNDQAYLGFSNFPENYEAIMILSAIHTVSGLVAIQYLIRKRITKKKLIDLYDESTSLGLNDREDLTLKIIVSPTSVGLKFSF